MSMKEAYELKLQSQLDEWTTEIDMIKAKADKADAKSKAEYSKQIMELNIRKKEAWDKLAELKSAGDEAWEDLKAGIENAWDSLGSALSSTASLFK